MACRIADGLPLALDRNLYKDRIGNTLGTHNRFDPHTIPCGGCQVAARAAGGHPRQDDEKELFHGNLCFEFVHLLRDARLRQHVEMKPCYATLDADIARKQAGICFYLLPGLLGGHVLDCEIARLSEKV